MAGRGGFAAYSEAVLDAWLDATEDDRERWDTSGDLEEQSLLHCSMDKAWRYIHYSLAHEARSEFSTLASVVLGWECVCETDGGDYLYLKRPDEVAEIHAALREIDQAELRRRFDAARAAGEEMDEGDFEYAAGYFEDMKEFYKKAAGAGLAVLFGWG
jgi:hypothetical protein